MLSWVANHYGSPRIPKKMKGSEVYWIQFSGDEAINIRQTFLDKRIPLLERKRSRWEELGADLAIKRKIRDEDYG